jgi:hypothetical protein
MSVARLTLVERQSLGRTFDASQMSDKFLHPSYASV